MLTLFYTFPMLALAIITHAVLAPHCASVARMVAHAMAYRTNAARSMASTFVGRHVRFANRGLYMARLTKDASRWPVQPHYQGGFVNVDCSNRGNPHANRYVDALCRDALRWVGPSHDGIKRGVALCDVVPHMAWHGVPATPAMVPQADADAGWTWQYGAGV